MFTCCQKVSLSPPTTTLSTPTTLMPPARAVGRQMTCALKSESDDVYDHIILLVVKYLVTNQSLI